MSERHLHIISFNIPAPPDYGGVIDVYFKAKALAGRGIKIHLHCFEYNRERSKDLEEFCHEVSYYARASTRASLFGSVPYIVKSRLSPLLLENLLKDNHPILFEGLHTCGYLLNDRLQGRMRFVRMHNIESRYYKHLFNLEKKFYKKLYFLSESWKLSGFQKVLAGADGIIAISSGDHGVLKARFENVHYIPPFHGNNIVSGTPGKGGYALYHGDLSIEENIRVAIFLSEKVFKGQSIPLVIAGRDPSPELKKILAGNTRVSLKQDLSGIEMGHLIANAHVNIVPSFNRNGFKLKLLNALFLGRFCIVNSPMAENTGLESLCTIANTADEIRSSTRALFKISFEEDEISRRKGILETHFSNVENARRVEEMLFSGEYP